MRYYSQHNLLQETWILQQWYWKQTSIIIPHKLTTAQQAEHFGPQQGTAILIELLYNVPNTDTHQPSRRQVLSKIIMYKQLARDTSRAHRVYENTKEVTVNKYTVVSAVEFKNSNN